MIRVLFVDDEQNILRALRRVLRRMAGQWSVTFVASGEDALRAVEREPFDAIVSDCMMPGMDGGTLVERVRRLRPGMVRILLTGNAPAETMLRAESVAHRLLSKPCPPERLQAAVDSAISALSWLPEGPLRDLAAGTPTLPTRAEVLDAVRTAAAGESPAEALGALSALVDGDPALEAKFLKLVHAGFFGGRPEPTPGAEAVRLLGPETVALFLRLGLPADAEIATGLDLAAEHRHAALVSATAARMAEHHGFSAERITTARVAGRLLGVGRLVAAAGGMPAWRAAADDLLAPGLGRVDLETSILGVPASHLGAAMLGLWGLPASVTAAIRGATSPEAGSLAEIVASADQSVRSSGGGSAAVDEAGGGSLAA